MKTKAAASRTRGTTSSGSPSAAPGPRRPRRDGANGIQAARPTSTTPAASAEHAGHVVGRRPPSLRTWCAWRPPLTAASTPNVNAIAARHARPQRVEARSTATHAGDERDRSGQRVLGQRNTAAGEQEGVVERVQERDDGGDAEHERLGRARAYGARNAGEQRGAAKGRRHGGCGHGRLSRSEVSGTQSSLPPAPPRSQGAVRRPAGWPPLAPGVASRTA